MALSQDKGAPETEATVSPNGHGLLEPGELAELGPPGESRPLPVQLIDPNPNNPRKALTEVEDLAASIKEFGLLQPVTVRRKGDRFELLGGHRRRAAFLHLQEVEPFEPRWKAIEAVIKKLDDDQSYLALLAGQLHSKSWQPREEAAALETLASTRTLPEVGVLVHKSAVWVSHRLRVYNDAVLSAFVQTGRLSMSVADELRLVPDPTVRREMADRAVTEQWERSTARAQVRRLKAGTLWTDLDRAAAHMLALLARVQPQQMPHETGLHLLAVERRLRTLSKGPVLPTIEQAQKAAKVNPDRPVKITRGRRKPGYKPRTG